MKFEDSRNALFPEPNAYIQNFEPREKQKEKSLGLGGLATGLPSAFFSAAAFFLALLFLAEGSK